MDFGALGFIPKTLGIEAMRGAIARVFEGGIWDAGRHRSGCWLGCRDRRIDGTARIVDTPAVRVLMMLSEGLLNKQIAYELGVSEATVKGARLGDPAKARCRESHASGNRGPRKSSSGNGRRPQASGIDLSTARPFGACGPA
jgi:hypothetical protein